MSQCVPSWDVDNNLTPPRFPLRSHSNSIAPDVPMLDYEVAELTWENGQISMHGLGFPRVPVKPTTAAAGNNTRPAVSTSSKYSWEKPIGGGTLESIVNQATSFPSRSKNFFDGVGDRGGDGDDLVPWVDPHRAAAAPAASNTMTMDALVPCSNRTDEPSTHTARGIGTCMVGSSTRAGSCSRGAGTRDEDAALIAAKRARVARVPIAQPHDWSSIDQNQSMSGSATYGRESQQMTIDTCDKDIGAGFTSTSMGSPGNTSSAKQCTKNTTADDHDSVCHSRPHGDNNEANKKKGTRKSSVSTKRSRAAAIHNQSERKRRDKINQRMKTLQKLVPNSSKTDKASMLDEVIEYLKQMQAQVQMMSRMNMSHMMLPMSIPQQLQMSMMAAPMGMGLGMGMGMGMGMDINTMGRPNIPGMPPVLHPSAFMPMASWDTSAAGDRLQGTPATMMPDLLSTFLACQSQPMTMDAYNRMAAMYQQLHQPPASSSKN